MIEKLKEKVEEINKANNAIIEPKKNLVLVIITAVCFFAVLVGIYFFTGDIKYIVAAVIAMVPLILYAIYSLFKEKRQNKRSERDKQEFLSGAKHRRNEWKTAYSKYKETHTFETISKKGMIYDLKKRYRKHDFVCIRFGILLTIGSVLILFIPMTELKHKVAAIFGILCGGVIFSIGLHGLISGPVQQFQKQQSDLSELERSYVKGKMLSFGNNGINIGSSYIVIYTQKKVFAIDNNSIQDLTRKMVRVKQYEDNLYSGQEYRYYVSLIYKAPDGKSKAIDVRLDEFQCKMMIAEFNRRFYPERRYNSTTMEITENSVSV